MKRALDIIGATIALTLTSPVWIVVAALIKLHDKGPVLYRGSRVGRDGVPFRMFKFRTMVVDADRLGGASASDGDSRITSVGRRLRKMKLDEMPQLINVLRGEMSLVGPRPEVQQYVDMYTEEERGILSVRPGITDWASLWNSDEGALLAGSPDPERTYLDEIRPHKLRLQLAYVQQQSIQTDLRIIGHTIAAVLFRKTSPAVMARRQEQ